MNDNAKSKRLKVIIAIVAAVAVLIGGLVWFLLANKEPEQPPTEPSTEEVTEEITTEPETEPPTEEPEPVMLDFMAELYAQNPEVVGWLRIDDTVVDYPVMHTPDDPEKYLRLDFDGHYKVAGTLFVDGKCVMDPKEETDNLIIYGHNMKNGSMFRTLHKYKDKSFWESHPEIYFSTLYEERTYEIVAAFYDRLYYKHEDVFKFYQVFDLEDEEAMANAMMNYQEKALYETGVTAELGDELLTLVTCSYHTDYGRFVVVARHTNTTPLEVEE